MGMKDDEADSPDLAHKLIYVSDTNPGITRKKSRRGFSYFDAKGSPIRAPEVIARIDALAIPPAYGDVWICPDSHGHIQATGRDARGRKQYRYHEQWTAVRDGNKYQQLEEFGNALTRIRRHVERDMKSRVMTHEQVVAVVVRLLELTLIRVGSRAYAKANKSFGLTTLRRRHISISGGRMRFRFRGKGGVQHDITVNDRRIAAVVKRCMDIPGHELFQFEDPDGTIHSIDSGCVNDYLKKAGAGDFTAKHYRTWAASVFAYSRLQHCKSMEDAPARKAVNDVVKETARLLGNTPAVCRSCYIHPAIMAAYLDGGLPPRLPSAGPRGLNADERRFFAFLRGVNETGSGTGNA